ncbi:MAG TPA: putative quinol monooxygenase [Anaeromyxobacteraceae bacterium]|nr:putative quinol monooxygenase [Anaeromyxobacteraceae bacterium]
MPHSLLVVHVAVRVKPDGREAFLRATLENARQSRLEPGILRFDLLGEREDPSSYLLVEVYRDEAAAAAHKLTPHYARWRDAVAPWMAEPRTSRKFVNLDPSDERW